MSRFYVLRQDFPNRYYCGRDIVTDSFTPDRHEATDVADCLEALTFNPTHEHLPHHRHAQMA